MKTICSNRFSLRVLLIGALAWFWAVAGAAASVIIPGDPADYEAQRDDIQNSPATLSAERGAAEELRVFSEEVGGFMLEEGRPIFQFDLSALTEPSLEAHLHLELLSVSANEPFSIEVWGTDSNREGPLFAGDSEAPGEFDASGYERAHPGSDIIADETSAGGAVAQDITVYLNERYDEYTNGGDSWIYLRLQPVENYGLGSGIDAAFSFASADHSNEDLRPFLEVEPIPEPRHAVLLLMGFAGLCLGARRLIRRKCLGVSVPE